MLPAALLAAAIGLATGCAAAPVRQRFEYARIVMGVEARIILYCDRERTAAGAAEAAYERLEELDAALSDYRPDSELNRVAVRAVGQRVRVSEDLYRVLGRAREFAEASDGAFDVTVGPLVKLWRLAAATGSLPEDAALAGALARTGWWKVSLESGSRTVELEHGGMRLDLGGIGKGFAAQEALLVLQGRGVRCALVELGGDLACGAPPPGAPGWLVEVVTAEGAEAPLILVAGDAAVAQSGDTEQFVEADGVRYSHIVDPRSGLGLTGGAAVTVVARDGTTADALATALSVLGPEEGFALLARFPDASAMIEVPAPEGPARFLSESFPWPAVLAPAAPAPPGPEDAGGFVTPADRRG